MNGNGLCRFCKHFTSRAECPSFPDGIPPAIIAGLVAHYDKVRGVAFEPRDDLSKVEKVILNRLENKFKKK